MKEEKGWEKTGSTAPHIIIISQDKAKERREARLDILEGNE